MRTLIVEHDLAVREVLVRQLGQRGIETFEAHTAAIARAAIAESAFDVVILDIGIEDGAALEVLQALHEVASTAHVIVVRDADVERIHEQVLALGVHDYVVKPFYARELTGRVEAVSRRQDADEARRLRAGEIVVDLEDRTVTLAEAEISLSDHEFDLLAFLLARPGLRFSPGEVLQSLARTAVGWTDVSVVLESMRSLRAKIEVDPSSPAVLVGIGDDFSVPDSGAATEPDTIVASGVRPGVAVHVAGVIVDVDDTALGLYGARDRDEVVGRSLLDFVAPGSLRAARSRAELTAAGVQQRSQLLVTKRVDGTTFLIALSTEPTTWEGRPAVRFVMAPVVDSERLQHLATGVLSEVSDAVIVTDTSSHIRLWNAAAQRLYGWSEADVLGRHVADVLEIDDLEDLRGDVGRSLLATGRWAGEVTQTTRDGTRAPFLLATSFLYDDDGRPVGVVSVNRPAAAAPVSAPRTPGAGAGAGDDLDVRRAIDLGEMAVHYQPVLDLPGGETIAVEALVRWTHPTTGPISPAQFVPIAERDGSIVDLGRFVYGAAARQLAAWRSQGFDLDLALNVSTAELANPQYPDRLAGTFATAGLDLGAVWLEVTETALVEDFEAITTALARLADLGARIAIDDFGTGWASLTYLREFPVHALKIDRTFVAGVEANPNDRAIIRSIVSLGAEMGLQVIAEGIETERQAEMLADFGCVLGQGFLFDRPTSADRLRTERMRRTPVPPRG